MNLAELMELLQCSRSTAQRRLKLWGCHTSYNHNGAYYALPEIVEFDQHGIWRCKSACFSMHGNLTRTVTALVKQATAGMTSAELSDVLSVNANSFIGEFVNIGKISRQKLGARFIYTSCDKQSKQQQIHCRSQSDQRAVPLSRSDAVTVLVELVKSPILSPFELARKVRSRAPTASVEAIEQFLDEHGVTAAAKKGAPPPS
jgi:hypothetical protein